MYQVFCRGGKKGARWVPYSGIYSTQREAEACKKEAEKRRGCDINRLLIRYEVRFLGEMAEKKKDEGGCGHPTVI